MKDFAYYAALEPRLLDLERLAESFSGPDDYDAELFWSSRIKCPMVYLVGFRRRLPGEPESEVVRTDGLVYFHDATDSYHRSLRIRASLLDRMSQEERDRHEELSTHSAYDAVYGHLYRLYELGIIDEETARD